MIPRAALLAVLALGAVGRIATAADACLDSARTDLERLYCQVVAEGAGQGLPSAVDFRRNDPQVQALLLRGPARRLGLKLPEVTGAPDRPASVPAPLTPEPASEPAAPSPVAAGRLADCRLQAERILCPGRRFDLALNRPNSELAPAALEPDNRLNLPSFEGDRADEAAVRRYLSDAYDAYIPKMVDIGLGANTMSFTAFYHAFQTLEAGGVDFAERMEQTYELLKQDKKTLAVKARYTDALPETLSLCDAISRDIIVCDNVATNWVFVSPDR